MFDYMFTKVCDIAVQNNAIGLCDVKTISYVNTGVAEIAHFYDTIGDVYYCAFYHVKLKKCKITSYNVSLDF